MTRADFDATLQSLAHRPWPVPGRPWTMHMRWSSLLFLHWPVAPAVLQARLPRGLELELFDGQAWLGIVPFRMEQVGFRGWPPLPFGRNFPELNVRTYVTDGLKPGVWFFSLEAGSPLAVAAARTWFHLPYFRARMRCEREGESIVYSSRRTHGGAPPAEFEANYGYSGDLRPARFGSVDHFLTARYCLYSADRAGRLWRGEIHHGPWPLRPARVTISKNTMAAAHRLALPAAEPLAHFVDHLDVVAWQPERVDTLRR